MNQSVIVIAENGVKQVISIDNLSKVVAASGDKFKIIKKINGEDQNINNFIAIKEGSDLEITFANGETLSLESFYSYNNIEIEFTVSDNSVYTLSSASDFGFDLEDGSTLVYAQGDQSVLMGLARGNDSLEIALTEQFGIANAKHFADASAAGSIKLIPEATVATEAGMSTATMVTAGVVVVAVAAGGSSAAGAISSGASLLTGYFIDSAVSGVDYYIGGVLKGQTGADGSFTYYSGDTVTFKVGNITIGDIASSEINADTKVMPQDLVGGGVTRADTTNTTVVKIAQLLQTLDADGDASNGITILTDADGDIVLADGAIDTNSDGEISAAELTAAQAAVQVDGTTNTLVNESTVLVIDENTTDTHITDTTEAAGDAAFVSDDDALLHLNDTTTTLDSTLVTVATTLDSDISTVMQDITLGDGTNVILSDASISSDQLVSIKAIIGAGTIDISATTTTITGTASGLVSVVNDATITTKTDYTATVSGEGTIAQLTAIDGDTTGTLTYTEVSDTVDNAIADVGAYITDTIIVTLTDAASAADANTIMGYTTGIVTATVTATGVVATLNTALSNADANDALTMVLDATSASAADLNTLDGKTSVAITATSITDVTSSTADAVNTMVTNISSVGLDGDWNVVLSDTTLAAADVKTINDANGTGTINMALATTLSSSSVSDVLEIVNNTGTDFTTATNYAVTLSDTTLAAADVKTINDANGTGTINMALATTLSSSSVSDMLEIVNNTGTDFTTATNYAVTLSDTGSVAAANLTTIVNDTTGTVNASAATTITGNTAEVLLVVNEADITTATDYAVTLSNAATLTEISTIDGDTTGVIDYTQIVYEDNDTSEVTTIANLAVNDTINLDADTTATLTIGNNDVTLEADEYIFDQSNDTLSWMDNDSNIHTLVLTGVDTVSISGNVITIDTLANLPTYTVSSNEDLTGVDLSSYGALVVDNSDGGVAITATMTLSQYTTLTTANITKSADDLIALTAVSGDLTAVDITKADSTTLSGATTLTATQVNALTFTKAGQTLTVTDALANVDAGDATTLKSGAVDVVNATVANAAAISSATDITDIDALILVNTEDYTMTNAQGLITVDADGTGMTEYAGTLTVADTLAVLDDGVATTVVAVNTGTTTVVNATVGAGADITGAGIADIDALILTDAQAYTMTAA
ncbi:MAG: hypothetical protein KAQ94_10255, partial [Arcobacteraceae bacterium]|nr:hypothetical protein [Arcobacteraceae bacterium]